MKKERTTEQNPEKIKNAKLCGLSYNKNNGLFYIENSMYDKVGIDLSASGSTISAIVYNTCKVMEQYGARQIKKQLNHLLSY